MTFYEFGAEHQNIEVLIHPYLSDVLHTISDTTIWRTFESCNYYAMPKAVQTTCKHLYYWYVRDESHK